jgi:serine/threonine protein kinase
MVDVRKNGLSLADLMHSLLVQYGSDDWDVSVGDFWCRVTPSGHTFGKQGWKLHVSGTPLSAPTILAGAGSVLLRAGCAFKFASTIKRVEQLVDTRFPRGSGGKFITAYPRDENHLRTLAEDLYEVTKGLPGPDILSDRRYRPHAPLFYRYGGFAGENVLTNDGCYESMLSAPDGSFVRDERLAWFAPPPWAVLPFPEQAPEPMRSKDSTRPVLLGGRFLVTEAIQHSNKGGVFRARDTTTDTAVVIKQARAHVGSMLSGRDVRDSLRHEAELLDLLEPSGLTPARISLFDQQGDVFLSEEELPGVPLSEWVFERMHDYAGQPVQFDEAAHLIGELIEIVNQAHQRDVVLCDLTPNNIMIGSDVQLRLIDLECAGRPGVWGTRGRTPGFAAPELELLGREAPAPALTADFFSLGAVILYLVSGAMMVSADSDDEGKAREERLGALVALLGGSNPTVRRLALMILGLTRIEPADRWDCVRAREFLDKELAHAGPSDTAFGEQRVLASDEAAEDADRLLADGLDYVLETMDRDGTERLWSSGAFGQETDPCNVQHGAAGVLATLVRAHQVFQTSALLDGIRATATWIRSVLPRSSRTLPGLYFGRSGTAWALHEAGVVLDDETLVRTAMDLALSVPVQWPNPDICHGLAGAGMAQLYFWRATGDSRFAERARACADGLAEAAYREPIGLMWKIPDDFDSELSGLRSYGFAHGVAGIGALLLAAGQTLGEDRYLGLAAEAGATLVASADVRGAAAWWKQGLDVRSTAPMSDWCNGSAGVGAFLCRLAQATGDSSHRELATRAAAAVYATRASGSSVTCHGLAGRAELLLDMATIFDEPRYRHWADELIAHITVRGTRRLGRFVVTDETTSKVTVDYNTGLSGVLALLMRMRAGGPRMWMIDASR